MSQNEKVRENRLRRMAQRQGLMLRKQRRRDPRAMDYGMYMVVDPSFNSVVAGTEATGRPGFTLDDVETWLTADEDERATSPLQGGDPMKPNVIRCGRCKRRCRRFDVGDWNAELRDGRIVNYLCPSCQSPEENAEAEANFARYDYAHGVVLPDGRFTAPLRNLN